MWSKEEGAFIWSIWHKAVANNACGARITIDSDDKRHMCMVGAAKKYRT